MRKLRDVTQLSLLDLFERPRIEHLWTPDQIYEAEDASVFSRLTEDSRFDRKSASIQPRDLARSLSAFGNGPSVLGGCLAIGIENDGRITGCRHLNDTRIHTLEDMGSSICPTGRYVTRRVACTNAKGEDDFVILARIAYVEDRLVDLTDGTAFVRRGDKVRKLTEQEKQEIRIDKGERQFELEPCSLNYPEDFDLVRVRALCRKILEERQATAEIEDAKVLENVRLGKHRDGRFYPNNACALLFSRDCQTVFPGAYIHFLQFNGTEPKSGGEYNVVKDRVIQGTILDVIENCAATIEASLRDFTTFKDGKFHTRPEYPRDAWYELIVNACAHRSYHAKTAPIFVRMFDDRLEVESPGGFMPQVTPENIYEMHRPRNTFMMLALRELGEVRCINEGTKRIRKEMADANLPEPQFRQGGDANASVVAVLRNEIANRTNSLDSEAYKILGEAVSLSLSVEERRIVNFIIENERINVSDALRLMKTTYWHTAKNLLTRLERRGVLDHITTKVRDPNAHYVIRRRNGE